MEREKDKERSMANNNNNFRSHTEMFSNNQHQEEQQQQQPSQQLKSEESNRLFDNFLSMFGEAVEPHIILKVLQNNNWDVNESLEELIRLHSESKTNVKENENIYLAEKEFEKVKIDEICRPSQDHPFAVNSNNFYDKNSLDTIKVVYKGGDDEDADVIIEEENEYQIDATQSCLPPVMVNPLEFGRSVLPNSMERVVPGSNARQPNFSSEQPTPSLLSCDRPNVLLSYQSCLRISDVQKRIVELVLIGVKIIVLMRGCPGSGKSFTAERLIQRINEKRSNPRLKPGDHIYSTDDYFMSRSGYKYNANRLTEAHDFNRKRVFKALTKQKTPVIVDNTNTALWEMQPYVEMGVSFGYVVEVLEPENRWKFKEAELYRRNVHSIPRSKIRIMLDRYEHNITSDNITQLINVQYFPPNIPPQFVPDKNCEMYVRPSTFEKKKTNVQPTEDYNIPEQDVKPVVTDKNVEFDKISVNKNSYSFPVLQNEIRTKHKNSLTSSSSASTAREKPSNLSSLTFLLEDYKNRFIPASSSQNTTDEVHLKTSNRDKNGALKSSVNNCTVFPLTPGPLEEERQSDAPRVNKMSNISVLEEIECQIHHQESVAIKNTQSTDEKENNDCVEEGGFSKEVEDLILSEFDNLDISELYPVDHYIESELENDLGKDEKNESDRLTHDRNGQIANSSTNNAGVPKTVSSNLANIEICKDFILLMPDGAKLVSRHEGINEISFEDIESVAQCCNAEVEQISDGATLDGLGEINETNCVPNKQASIYSDLYFSELKDDPVSVYFSDEQIEKLLRSQNEQSVNNTPEKEEAENMIRLSEEFNDNCSNSTDGSEDNQSVVKNIPSIKIDIDLTKAIIDKDSEEKIEDGQNEQSIHNDKKEESLKVMQKDSSGSFASCIQDDIMSENYFDVLDNSEVNDGKTSSKLDHKSPLIEDDNVLESVQVSSLLLTDLTEDSKSNDTWVDSEVKKRDKFSNSQVFHEVEDKAGSSSEPKPPRKTQKVRASLETYGKHGLVPVLNKNERSKALLKWDTVSDPYADWFEKVKDTIGTASIDSNSSAKENRSKPQREKKESLLQTNFTYKKGNITVLDEEGKIRKENAQNKIGTEQNELSSNSINNSNLGTEIVKLLVQDRFPALEAVKKSNEEQEKKNDDENVSTDKLGTLSALFPQVQKHLLQELLKECRENINWAADILIEGREISGDGYSIPNLDVRTTSEVEGSPSSPEEKDSPSSSNNLSFSTASGTIPKRGKGKRSVASTETAMELKKMIEQNVVLNESNYSDHVLKLIKMRKGDMEMSNSFLDPENLTSPFEQNSFVDTQGCGDEHFGDVADGSFTRNASNNIEGDDGESEERRGERDGSAPPEEEFSIELMFNPEMVSVLQQNFGSPGLPPYTLGTNCPVKLPISLARQLHSYLMDAFEQFLIEEEERMKQMIKEDEELARCLQEEEQIKAMASARNVLPLHHPPPPLPPSISTPTSQTHTPETLRLQEIIDMEMALAFSKADQESEQGKRDSNASVATRLAKSILSEKYPKIDKKVLFDLLSTNNNSLHDTIAVLRMNEEADNDVLDLTTWKQQLMAKAKAETEGAAGGSDVVGEYESPSSEEKNHDWEYFRNEASRQSEERKKNFEKAQQAYNVGNKSVASYYSQLANINQKKFEQANFKAATALLWTHVETETETTLDLHFYQVKEAVVILDVFLDASIIRLEERQLQKNNLYIITGRGLHSADGRSKIKPAVVKRLNTRQITYTMVNPGMLRCMIYRNSPLSSQPQSS